ncbi:DNA polymerase alpha subunit B [Taenia crassiceps]|uniref:DNA polymerase alpha subunit B n=1 Tax=Taenia crassiceps TaxID=6207 RepID=A0ABR4QGR6_9CEST
MDALDGSLCGRIRDELGVFGLSITDDDLLEKFIGLSTKYCVTPLSLVEKYIAFRHNRGLSDSLSEADILQFEKEGPKYPVSLTLSSKHLDEKEDVVSFYLDKSVPNSLPRSANTDTSRPVSLQGAVKSSAKILCSFSTQVKDHQSQCQAVLRFPLLPLSHTFPWKIRSVPIQENNCSRYMYQQPLIKAELLDSWTWDLIKRIVESLPPSVLESTDLTMSRRPRFSLSSVLDTSIRHETSEAKRTAISALRPVHSRLQTPSLVAGRVAVHPEIGSVRGVVQHQRLDSMNVCIVGTRRAGGGDLGRVMLDVNTNASTLVYSLYTGQPVVLKAINVNGRSLTAFEFYQPKIPPIFNISEGMCPDLHVAIACGPFTTSTSHDISPLLDLLKSIKEQQPHVLILLGPFVDSSHPLIGQYCDSTFEELYQSRLNTVAEWCFLLKTKVVVVSSWREVCGSPVYPTPPPFNSAKPPWAYKNPEVASWYENVTFVWDPSTIKIGPYYVGLSSPDVLFHMSSEEISANCSGDRLARLCRHILASGTYYPVHPAPEHLPLDYPLWWEHARLPPDYSPHCVILPSRLRTFIKNVEGVVCVNPGLTARPTSAAGGSYARLFFTKSQVGDSDQPAEKLLSTEVVIQGEVLQL